MKHHRSLAFALWAPATLAAFLAVESAVRAEETQVVQPKAQLSNPAALDQDDFCVWIHRTERAQSAIVASDKKANALFVYDLQGKLLQTLPATKPGNIDIRQGVKLAGESVDLVVVNQRDGGFKLHVYRVDPQSRTLERLDTENILTGPNYGGCLYLSKSTGKLSFLCTSDAGTVEQHEISAGENGGIVGKKVRSWTVGKCEGAVADDENSAIYIAEEAKGIWKFAAEPDRPADGELIARVGTDDLKGDLEGLAIYRGPNGSGCLVVSDQGRNSFVAFDRAAPHRKLGEFAVAGAAKTDGIEIVSVGLGPDFPGGLFACHTDEAPRPVLLSSWRDILGRLQPQSAAR